MIGKHIDTLILFGVFVWWAYMVFYKKESTVYKKKWGMVAVVIAAICVIGKVLYDFQILM